MLQHLLEVVVPYQDANPVAFSTDFWVTIIDNVKVGNTDKYKVGDTKEIDLESLWKYVVRIANKSSCLSTEYLQTSCGFLIEFAGIILSNRMNSTATNVGGLRDSEMRTYLNNTVYKSLPQELQSAILSTSVISEYDTTTYTTTDKLYLFSPREIYGSYSVSFDSSGIVTKQLDYYADNGLNGVKTTDYSPAIKTNNGTASFCGYVLLIHQVIRIFT